MSMTGKAPGPMSKKPKTKTKPPLAETVVDPGLYAKCSKPRPIAEAEASALTFVTELATLREKHGIADLVYAFRVTTDDVDTESLCFSGFRGSQAVAVTLAHLCAEKTRADYEALARAVAASAT